MLNYLKIMYIITTNLNEFNYLRWYKNEEIYEVKNCK